MAHSTRKVSYLVGLSTEEDPSSLGRTECPFIQNVDVDRGGLVRTRDGYKRLSLTQAKDASWRLRGAPYHATLYREFNDAIVIPANTRYNVAAGAEFFVMSICVGFEPSGIGSTVQQLQTGFSWVVSSGNNSSAAAHPVQLYLDYSGGIRWNAVIYDGVSATAYTARVSDPALDATSVGKTRYVQVSVAEPGGGVTVRLILDVYDLATGTLIGQTITNIGATWSLTTGQWILGGGPDATGFPGIVAFNEYLPARIGDFRIETSGRTISINNGATSYNRELRPSEYSVSSIKGYWRLSDGAYDRVYDSCDTIENTRYTGTLKGNHGAHWNVAPQWIKKDNLIPIDNGTNANVVDGSTGVRLLRRAALLFGGLQGHFQGRAGWVQGTVANDPLGNIYAQAPAAGVGWTVEIVFTPLVIRDATVYPDSMIYSSGFGVGGAINPIRIEVVSNQFVMWFNNGGAIIGPLTIVSHNVSDFAGEMVTLVATKNNATITFFAIGENKVTTPVTIASAAAGLIVGGPSLGPFVLIGRTCVTTANNQSDHPVNYGNQSWRAVFHEFRLWSEPHTLQQCRATANREVPIGARDKLSVYLIADAGSGNQLSNYGTSVQVTIPTITVGTQVYSQTSFLDTRIYPQQESGPIPSEGLVVPYSPVQVKGAVDYRNIIGEGTARQLVFMAGGCLYVFDAKTNTVTARSGGVFKRQRLFSIAVLDGNVYFTNGGRARVWDGNECRFAGIEPPIQRPYIGAGQTSAAGGTLNDGDYLVGYRFGNTRAGVFSNISPLRQFTLAGGNTSSFVGLSGLEVPTDPQVNVIEIFATLEGDASRLYRIAQVTNLTAGSHTFSPLITALLVTTAPVNPLVSLEMPNFLTAPVDFGDLFRFGAPPPCETVRFMPPGRMLYAATDEPGTIFFSRIDGGFQPEHVDLTPGANGSVAIKTDAGDKIQTMELDGDDMAVYLRDAVGLLTLTGLDQTTTGGLDIPFQVSIRNNDVGAVGPAAVCVATGAHVLMAESKIVALSRREFRLLSSPPRDITNPSRPKIGRTLRELPGDYLGQVVAMHRWTREQIHFAITEEGFKRNNAALIYSYRDSSWTRYAMPYLDYILEVELDGERRIPVGFINGFVCQLDETGVYFDSSDGVFGTPSTTTAFSTSVGTALVLTSNVYAKHGLRGRHAWIGSLGDYVCHVIADNESDGAHDVLYLDEIPTAPIAGATAVWIATIMPMFDLMLIPATETDLKRYVGAGFAFTHEACDAFAVNAWFNAIGQAPAGSAAQVKAAVVTPAGKQFARSTAIRGLGRMARIRLYSPTAGTRLNISEVGIEFQVLPSAKYNV